MKLAKRLFAGIAAVAMLCTFVGCGHTHTWNDGYVSAGESGHYQTCTGCEEHSETAPHEWGTAYTSAGANGHTKACTECGATSAVESHNWGTAYTSAGANGHTQACTNCGATSAVAPHAFDNDADTTCNNCDYTRTVVTPDPGPGGEQPGGEAKGSIVMNSKVPDQHQNTQEKDAAWTRYTLPVLAAPGSEELASYFVSSYANWNIPTDGATDLDGYDGIGGFRSSKAGDTMTYTFYASDAGEAGIYFEMSFRSDEAYLSGLYDLTVNGTAVDATKAQLRNEGEGLTANGPSNLYTFVGYVNLVKGLNTVVLTRNEGSISSAAYNWWGMRLTADALEIGLEEFKDAPAAGASKLPDAHQGTQEKDASWARYTLPLRAEPGSNDLASYVVVAGATASVPSEGADEDGYNGVGGFRAAYGATITITVNASAACEAGLYFEMSARTSEVMMGSLFTLAVNGTAVDVSAVKLQTTEGTDN
ncbi:MAG: hypothetical protein IKD43_05475, partial [Clostridia bacterium]|nr:hypothetical protein [Clostridia bacterium]